MVGVADPGQLFPIDLRTSKPVVTDAKYEMVALPIAALERLVGAGKLAQEGNYTRARETLRDVLDEMGLGSNTDPDHVAGELGKALDVLRRDDIGLFFDEHRITVVDLPQELWMREFLAVDREDVRGCLQFLCDWGPLVLPDRLLSARDVAHIRWRPGRESVLVAGDEARPEQRIDHRIELYQTIFDVLGHRHPGDPEEQMIWSSGTGNESEIVEATGYSDEIQVLLVDVYQAAFTTLVKLRPTDLTPRKLKSAPRRDLARVWTTRELPEPSTTFELVDTTIDAISSAASALGPRAEFVHPRLKAGGLAIGQPLPRILTAMCVQALAWLADGTPARRCENEACGSWFTHQRGRAKFGQHRSTGVLYCSASCAKAQAQRAYRRRRR